MTKAAINKNRIFHQQIRFTFKEETSKNSTFFSIALYGAESPESRSEIPGNF
jgi:hypothetical protein